MPPKAQQDLAQSAAEGAALGKQRASDILAERLPGLNDPSALADSGSGQKPAAAAATTVPAPLHPPPTLHADHFSPQATPPANALTPGQTIVDPKYARRRNRSRTRRLQLPSRRQAPTPRRHQHRTALWQSPSVWPPTQ